MAKKISYDRVKPASQINYEESIKKQQIQPEKPMIKYVRSATNITKNADIPHHYNTQKPSNYDIPNREETDPTGPYLDHRTTNYLNYPKYSNINKQNEPVKQSQHIPMSYNMPNAYVGGSWKGIKSPSAATNVLSSNEIK